MSTQVEASMGSSEEEARDRRLRRGISRKEKGRGSRAIPLSSGSTDSDLLELPDNDFDRLVLELLPVVKRMACTLRRRLPARVELDDLVGAGSLGLLDAIGKFDRRREVKLTTYARHRIRGAMLDSLRTLDEASRDLRQKKKQVEKAYQELESRLRRPPADSELASELGMSLKEWHRTVQDLQALGFDGLWTGGPVRARPDLREFTFGNKQEDPFERCYRLEQREILRRAIACLPERLRLVVSLYVHQGLTMKQIATKLGVDESRVSQIYSAGLVRLRKRVLVILRGSGHIPCPTDAQKTLAIV